ENLKVGRRPTEIEQAEAALSAARAQRALSEQELTRRRELFARNVSSKTDMDNAISSNAVALAKESELSAALAHARLPAREHELQAAEHRVVQARMMLARAREILALRSIVAGTPGVVEDVIRNAGEVAGPTAPVISLLPDRRRKLRFYVP